MTTTVLEIVKSKGAQLKGLLLGGSTKALTDGTVEAIASHCESIESLDFELGLTIKPESFDKLAKNCRLIKVCGRKKRRSGVMACMPACLFTCLVTMAVLIAAVALVDWQELTLCRCQLLTSECLSKMAKSLPNLQRLNLNSIGCVDDTVLLALVEGCHKSLAEVVSVAVGVGAS